eukprot:7285151-Pyramimonas_sp.AAC.1
MPKCSKCWGPRGIFLGFPWGFPSRSIFGAFYTQAHLLHLAMPRRSKSWGPRGVFLGFELRMQVP